MVYLAAIAGFFCGFFAGQAFLSVILRGYSRKEILEKIENDRGWKFKYGLLNWAVSLAGAFLFVYIYRQYAAGP